MGKAHNVLIGAVLVLAVVAHALVGVFIFFSGLVTHPALWGAGLIAWGAGLYLMGRWCRRVARISLIPTILAGAYFAVLLVGERIGLVGA